MIAAMSIFERAMGERFGRLPAAVQRFHRLAGRQVLRGEVRIDAPASLAARLVAACLGLPRQAQQGSLRFELDGGPEQETWTRRFPGQTMASRLYLVGGQLTEQLGPARLGFDLHEVDGRLEMRLAHLRVLGLPCPRLLMPRVTAHEAGEGDHLLFNVEAVLPIIGLVAGYRGHLVVPHGGPAWRPPHREGSAP
jgi:hypothetical protein